MRQNKQEAWEYDAAAAGGAAVLRCCVALPPPSASEDTEPTAAGDSSGCRALNHLVLMHPQEQLFAVGGQSGKAVHASMEQHDPSTGRFTLLPRQMRAERKYTSCSAMAGAWICFKSFLTLPLSFLLPPFFSSCQSVHLLQRHSSRMFRAAIIASAPSFCCLNAVESCPALALQPTPHWRSSRTCRQLSGHNHASGPRVRPPALERVPHPSPYT